MAYTQADLDAIESAIKSGTLKVEYQDKKVEYRSLREMQQIRNTIADSLNSDAKTQRPIRVNVQYDSGLR